MCIIAVEPKGINIEKQYLENCWKNNTNGGGFMFTNGEKVLIYKTLISFDDYFKNYQMYKKMYPNSVFIHHFRISTHGKVNVTNCHPFKVNDELAFCHNGIFHDIEINNEYSDTYMFNQIILKKLPNDFLKNDGILELIDSFCGMSNKLAFLNSKNEYKIINEIAGVWHNGIWYSNHGYSYKKTAYLDYGGTSMVGNYFAQHLNKNTKAKKNQKANKKEVKYNSQGSLLVDETCMFCGGDLVYTYEKNRGYCFSCNSKNI